MRTVRVPGIPAGQSVRRRLADVVYSDRQRQFGCNKRDTLTDCCRRCPYRFACHGECPKNRFIKSPDGQPGHNYLCSGLRRFFAYADPYLRQLAGQVLRNRAVGSQPKRATARSAIDTKLQQSTG